MKKIGNWLSQHRFLIAVFGVILLLFSCTIIIFCFNGNLFCQDILFHYLRITGIVDGLKGGQFPVKLYPNFYNGNGYISPLTYGDLFLYLPAILYLIGIPINISYIIFVYLLIFAYAISYFYLANKVLKNKYFSLLASTFFILSQYIFCNFFIRASIGESIGILFLIWLVYGIINMLYEDFSKPWILSVSMLGLLYSHIITLFFACILLIIVVLINLKKLISNKKFFIKAIWAFFIFLIGGAYFLFSFIEIYFSDVFEISYPWTILSNNSLGFLDIMFKSKFGIGWIFIILLIFRIFYKSDNKTENKIVNFGIVISLILITLTSKLIPWKLFNNILGFIQFPWRINMLTSLILPIILVIELKNIKLRSNKIFSFFLIIFILFIIPYNNLRNFNLKMYIFNPNQLYYDIIEWLPASVDLETINSDILLDSEDNEIVYSKKENTTDISFDSTGSDYYILPTIYYKGYVAYITTNNGEKSKLDIEESSNGKIIVKTNGQVGYVNVFYKGTTIQTISLLISIIGSITICSFYTINAFKSKFNKKNYNDINILNS